MPCRIVSRVMTPGPGDIICTGTPAAEDVGAPGHPVVER
jgi:2-keto-4-pentenoate hydratase/2-oxohepta-3-ene-1,7-dioic acid hydratase in catechol pathway